MIARPTLSPIELRVLIAVRAAWNLIGSMPDHDELAALAEVNTTECKQALESLRDRHVIVLLPDGGMAPTTSV